MGLIYKPFGIVLGLIGGLLGQQGLRLRVDQDRRPRSRRRRTTEETTWRRLLAAAAVQGMIFRVTRYVVERYGAIGFHYLTGTWPGQKRPDPDE